MHTGEKIKVLRNLRNLTQSDLAERINKTRALVSHIEQTGKVNHYTLLKILKVLKVSEEEFDNLNPEQINHTLKQSDSSNEQERIISQIQEKLVYYQKANETLQELVDAQKIIINSLKKKNK
jgi:transcriptional regulator with XRE-family HTH domain